MRLFTHLIFDQFVRGTGESFSPPEFNDALGKAHDLVYEVEVEEAGGSSPTLTVKQQWSNSGKAFPDAATLVNGQSLASLPLRVIVTRNGPMAANVRVSVALGASDNGARVRIWATGWSA